MDHEPGRLLTRIATVSARFPLWVVLGWVVVIGGLNVAVPQLETVMADDSTPIAPADLPSSKAIASMDASFGNGRSTSFAFVVLQRDSGLTKADRRYVKELSVRLREDTEDVSFVQDVVAQPDLLKALTSKDGRALYLQVGIPGETGAPTATRQIEGVREATEVDRPDGLGVAVTGPAATIGDMAVTVEHSILVITFFTVGLIAIILMLIYRSVAVTALTLTVIGLSLGAARALAALCGLHVFSISTFTASFLTAVVLGASTDYVVFVISRFHELRRSGVAPIEAVVTAAGRVSGVIIGSALTVVIANACMAIADVGIFTTTGPAIAVGVAVTLLMALTLTPALMTLAVGRGLLEPGEPRSEGRWERVASRIRRTPGRVLLAGLVPLLALAALYPTLQVSFDESVNQPDDSGSNRGYAMLAEHFPLNEVLPDYVVISADHDLRNAKDLAALEQTSATIARTAGVERVRSITRPLGEPIKDASIPYQAGRIGDRLGDAGADVADGRSGATRLDAGAGDLADGAGQVADGADDLSTGAGRLASGADQAVVGAGRLVGGMRQLEGGVKRLSSGAGTARSGSADLRRGADTLADALEAAQSQTQVAVDGLGTAYRALRSSLGCGLDPVCAAARDGVRQVYEGERDQLVPGLARAATGARQLADGSIRLDDGLAKISSGLDTAERGANDLADGQALLKDRLGDLASGARQVSDGTGRLADGAGRVADGAGKVKGGTEQAARSIAELEKGLGQAADYLQQVGAISNDPAVGGFYLPPDRLKDKRLTTATGLFLTPDGRTARLFVLGSAGAFSHEAMDRSGEVRQAVHAGLRDTGLEVSRVQLTGIAPLQADLEDAANADFHLVALAALLAVFLILLVLLRSLVAATFLLATVVLSYAAAIGLSVLVWQVLLDRPLDWSVPMIAFILLVAVGADYNLLLMKRMKEESPNGSPDGIARAVVATGGVITTAGIIFAASVFAMMAGGVQLLSQIGFTIGMGLLIDTFVVRTLVVPAGATLLGRRLWSSPRSGS